MKTTLTFFSLALLLLTVVYTSASTTGTHRTTQNISQLPKPLATETFNLMEKMEVGLEIEARLDAVLADPVCPHEDLVELSRDGVSTAGLTLGAHDTDLQLGDSVGGLRALASNIVERSPDELGEHQHASRLLRIIRPCRNRRGDPDTQ